MKKPVILYVAALAVLFFFWGCDTGPDLTPVTQEGKNTFSCKINGKVWIPEEKVDRFGTLKPIYGGYLTNAVAGSKSLHLRTFKGNIEEVSIYLKTVKIGIHPINKTTVRREELSDAENYGWIQLGANIFMTSKNNTGWIKISRADSTGIISGTFEFNATTRSGKKIQVTDGRFDIVSQQ